MGMRLAGGLAWMRGMVNKRQKIGADARFVAKFQPGLAGRSPLFGKDLITACHRAIRPAEAAESGA
jgi:hypothetical protein